MIVNVNPYDTGYDENSHVMKFAALAREVYINPAPAPIQRVAAVGSSKLKSVASPEKKTRKVTISLGGPGTGRKATESVLEVLEGAFIHLVHPRAQLIETSKSMRRIQQKRIASTHSSMRCLTRLKNCECR